MLLLLSVYACGLLAEISLRVYYAIRRAPIQLDATFGWIPTGGWTIPACDPARQTVLILGDSYTQATEVSPADTYHARIGTRLGVNVVALGCRGYGSAQAYLALDRYFETVNPALVLVQLSTNDIINNSLTLERLSTRNNNHMRRPYWLAGVDVYATPDRFPNLRNFANGHARLLYFLLNRVDRIAARGRVSVEETLTTTHFADYQAAVNTTAELLRMMRRRVPAAVPIYAFIVDDAPTQHALITACVTAGLTYLPGVADAIQHATGNVWAADGAHWNAWGHQVAAEVLTPALRGALKISP
jgi:lysophospholipase L1-like esterase